MCGRSRILSLSQTVARELALIKVKSTSDNVHEIIEQAHLFGAHAVDMAPEAVTLEVTGSEEKIEKLDGTVTGLWYP